MDKVNPERLDLESQAGSFSIDKAVVRRLREEDLPALEWEGEYAHFRRVYADTFQRGKLGLSVNWVVELPVVGVVGQAFVLLNASRAELADGKNRAYLYSFRIRPAYRKLGIGALVIKTIEDDLKKRKYRVLTLIVGKENDQALRFYRQNGFKISAHEPGVWSYQDQNGNWQDVEEPGWRMQKKIA